MSNKQKTPLQRLIAEYERLQNDAKTFQEKIFFNGVIAVAKTKLPYEREQMKGMYTEGSFAKMRYYDGLEYIDAEQYFNQTFQDNE